MQMDIVAGTVSKVEIDQLNQKAKSIWRSTPQIALDMALEADKLAQDASFGLEGYTAGLIASRTIQAHTYIELSEFSEGLRIGISAETLAAQLGDLYLHAGSLGALAGAYQRMTNYPKAQDCAQRQFLIAREINDRENTLEAILRLSSVYGESGEYASCIQFATEGLTLLDDSMPADRRTMCGFYNNLSVAHGFMGQSEIGLQYGLTGLEVAKNSGEPAYVALLLSVATAYQQLEDFDEALSYYWEGLQALEDNSNIYYRAVTVFDIANTLYYAEDYPSAQAQAERALELTVECNSLAHQSQCYELLSRLAQQRGEFELALTYYQQFHQMKNSATGEQNVKQMRMLRASYEIDMAQKDAELYRARTVELETQVDRRTKALKEALERERVLGAELSDALHESQAANELRSRIIETVSHEFRTPLTVINASVDLLITYGSRMSDAKQAKLQMRIRDAIFQITDLLQDVSLVDSADSSTIQPNWNESTYGEICLRIAERIGQDLGATDRIVVTFDGTPEQVIKTDENLVRQILQNLLSNALKFSPPDSLVRFHTTVEAKWITVEVSDEGIGILPDERNAIFELMRRGSNIETQRGLGLGLYIARSIAQVLGGRLSATSPGLDQGSTFTLRIPC